LSRGKRYDREYFERWYRSDRAVVSPALIGRKARLALAAAEHLLGRSVITVLDVGCGEGQWRAPLLRARPGIAYTGIDPSEYAVKRYGARRNIRPGSFGALDRADIAEAYDLIICSDVLQYVPAADLRNGLRAIADRLSGVAYIEAFTTGDDMIGDHVDWHDRSADEYRRVMRQAGLLPLGLYCYLPQRLEYLTNELERCC
jgi:SAM-dependent methyltransferase